MKAVLTDIKHVTCMLYMYTESEGSCLNEGKSSENSVFLTDTIRQIYDFLGYIFHFTIIFQKTHLKFISKKMSK